METNPSTLSGWSSLLKQQQPPPKPSPQPLLPPQPQQQENQPSASTPTAAAPNGATVGSCKSTKGITVAVVDANAIIHGGLSLTHVADRFVSVSEVLSEIRDPNSRHSLNFLPFTVDTLEPSPESLKKVVSFARATGDLQTLSDVDLKLIALTYTLEAQTHGTQHIRDSPPPMRTVNVKRLPEKDLPGWGSNVPNIEEWEALENAEEGELNSESKILPLKDLNLNVIPKEQNGLGNGIESQSGSQGDADDGVGNNKKYGTKKVEVKLEGKMVADGVDATKGEFDESAGDWQPAVGRSTRRRFLRRKARNESRQASEKADEKDLSDELENGNCDESECPEVLVNEGAEKVSVQESEEGVNALLHQLRLEEESCDAPRENIDLKSSCGELNERENFVDGHADDDENEGEEEEEEEEDLEVSSELDMDMPSLNGESTTDGSHLDDHSSEQSWTVRSLSESTVACVTSDFAMQNVLLQMGLRILATGGMQIRELHRWVLKCHACNKVTADIGRVFCPTCGNGGTLRKVAVTVGENGGIIASRKPRVSIRGTKFSLPRPQGGRTAITKNPVLREDQLPQKYLYPKTRKPKKQGENIYMPDDIFMHHGDKGSALQPPIRKALAVFSGRKNPNDNHYSRAKH